MLLRAEHSGGARTDSPYQVTSLSDVVKFTALASALAIFLDAAIAHAMFWGNDPYWTYWVTDPLLMATVFGLGTMLFGIGIGRGALITAVHVLLLTTYYWSLSPIGLPSHPEWLDLERTWITGLPAHLAVYYMGYLGAMWLWRHRRAMTVASVGSTTHSLAGIGVAALVVSASIVVVTGLIQALLFQEFPGLTWFVMRLAVATPFALAWWLLAGSDQRSAIAGGVLLALLLTTYSHYLGPVGLPSEPARLLAGDSPPTDVHWLSYRQEFMVMLPLTAIIASIGYWFSSSWLGGKRGATFTRPEIMGGITAAAGLIILGAVTARDLGPEANQVAVTSSGPATIVHRGEDVTNPGVANLRMTVANRNTHRTPLPPHDSINLAATVAANGRTYEISANQALIADPEGRFTTWHGVGFGEWHTGRSGIGLLEAPPMKSDIVAFALGEIRSNGQLIATGVPLQVSATSANTTRLDLRIGHANALPLATALQASWSDFRAETSERSKYARYLFGGGVLLLFLVIVFMAARRQQTLLLVDRRP